MGPRGWEAYEAAVSRFATDLRRVRLHAGNISYRRLAELLETQFGNRGPSSLSSVNRAFQGRSLPSWNLAAALLAVMGVNQREIQTVWQPRWASAREMEPPAQVGPPRHAPLRAVNTRKRSEAGAECGECGSWVTNQPRHQQWHGRLEQIIDRLLLGRDLDRTVDAEAQKLLRKYRPRLTRDK